MAREVSPMVSDGKILWGTPAHRLQQSVAEDADIVQVYAGDLSDVCRLCDHGDKFVAEMSKRSAGKVGITLDVKTEDVRRLLNTLTSKVLPVPEA